MVLLETPSVWNKQIKIEMTVKELQELYCALAITSYHNRKEAWNKLWRKENCVECPFGNDGQTYDSLRYILKEVGGKTIT